MVDHVNIKNLQALKNIFKVMIVLSVWQWLIQMGQQTQHRPHSQSTKRRTTGLWLMLVLTRSEQFSIINRKYYWNCNIPVICWRWNKWQNTIIKRYNSAVIYCAKMLFSWCKKRCLFVAFIIWHIEVGICVKLLLILLFWRYFVTLLSIWNS